MLATCHSCRTATAIAAGFALLLAGRQLQAASFVRGDVDQNGTVEITDPIRTLGYLFLGTPAPESCLAAADADDDGRIDISDAVYLLHFLFLGGPKPRPPFPACAIDPSPGGPGCQTFKACGGPGNALQDNVAPVGLTKDPRDPVLVALDETTTTVDDPAGGYEAEAGAVIVGRIPRGSPSAALGLAYMRKVVRVRSRIGARKVLETEPALLTDVFKTLSYHAVFNPTEVLNESIPLNPRVICGDLGGGGGAEEGSGGAAIGFDLPRGELINKQDGAFGIAATLIRGRMELGAGSASDIDLVLDLTEPEFKFFYPLTLDTTLEVQIDGKWNGDFQAERQVHKVEAAWEASIPLIPGIFDIPIQVTFSHYFYAGIEGNLQGTVYGDLGANAHFWGGIGIDAKGDGIENLTGLHGPTSNWTTADPTMEVDGSLDARVYIRPEVGLSIGLKIDHTEIQALGTGFLAKPKPFVRLRVDGQGNPGDLLGGHRCIHYGTGAGLGLTLSTNVRAFGLKVDLPDLTLPTLESDLGGGTLGCLAGQHVPIASFIIARIEEIPIIHTALVTYSVTFDATFSNDPDNGPGDRGIREYIWDFDGDGICDLVTANPIVVWDYVGPPLAFRCKLRVVDDEGQMDDMDYEYPPPIPH